MSMFKLGFVLSFVCPIVLSFCLSAEASDSSISAGATDYVNHCAACHGVAGQGDGTVAEFLAIPAADLTVLAKNNDGKFPRDRTIMVIDGRQQVRAHGVRNMPVWGDLFKYEEDGPQKGKAASEAAIRKRIEALVDYIQSIQEH
jgi:mono/diheme cytochrome c family protein